MDPDEKSGWERFQHLKPNRKKIGKKARRLEVATLRHAHKFLIQRWTNVREVRRHMLGWLLLVTLLIGVTILQLAWYRSSYTVETSLPGGTYAEGVVGPLDTFNPLYATTNAERSASRLLFAGLLSYDQESQLRGELANSWSMAKDGEKYTVTLRKDATWHDGQSVTSKDVAFTLGLIKNPDVRSPLRSSWESIDVTTPDSQTVVFTLPSPYAPFPHALTFGVLPEHLLKDVPVGLLRESSFNKAPVGSGPFAFRNVQTIDAAEGRKVLHLRSFAGYVGGQPKLDRFQLHIYKDPAQLRQALVSNEVGAVGDLTAQELAKLDMNKFKVADVAMNNGAFALFRGDGVILRDVEVRRALRLATDTAKIRERLGGHALPLNGPIIGAQYREVMAIQQPLHNAAQAERILNKAGWRKNDAGIRVKKGIELSMSVIAVKSGDYPAVLEELAGQWRRIGVKVETRLVNAEDVQQSVLRPRAYDVLLYELAIGADPDVFAYWHSSQMSQNGLNFANYSSPLVDDALESARARNEVTLRAEKYKTFTQQWLKDVPAVALYRPVLSYVTTQNVRAIPDDTTIVDAVDRYRMVPYWTVERGLRYTTP